MREKHSTMKSALGVLLAFVTTMTAVPAASAEDTMAVDGGRGIADAPWEFAVTPYIWATSLDGSTTVQGSAFDVDVPFSALLRNVNFVFSGEAEVRKGPLAAYVNYFYADLGHEESVQLGPLGPGELDTLIQLDWFEFGASWRFDPIPLESSPRLFNAGASVSFEPYAGGRYTFLKVKQDIRSGPTAKGSVEWVDPVIGLRTNWTLSQRWNTVIFGDVGGFGVGSDFSWSATGLIGYRVDLFGDRDGNVLVGWRALGQDYAEGSGPNAFAYDVVSHGPVFALGVSF